jgi:hypothetical protein
MVAMQTIGRGRAAPRRSALTSQDRRHIRRVFEITDDRASARVGEGSGHRTRSQRAERSSDQ